MFTEESFEVFKWYEDVIHKKKDKEKESYERFLCQSPLFDPEFGHNFPDSQDYDSVREMKDEGIVPTETGSYHLYHWIDG